MNGPRRAALLLVLLLPACGDLSARADETPRPRNAVMICLDTVRADRLGCYGYATRPTTPTLDALAARGVLFRDASSTAGWTKPSVPSFFTGTWPAQHGVYEGSARAKAGAVTDLLGDQARTLAESFEAAGYQTSAFIHNAQLKLGNGFEQGFDDYHDRMGDARDIRWQALDWLDERDEERPFFLYLHILDAHWPYDIPDEAAERFADGLDISMFRGGDSRALRDAINDGEVVLDEEQRRALDALYDASLRSIDDELAQLLAGLERRGLADDTTICVVSDHGEEFLEHGRIGHGHGLWENLLSVPWILAGPDVPADVVTRDPSATAQPRARAPRSSRCDTWATAAAGRRRSSGRATARCARRNSSRATSRPTSRSRSEDAWPTWSKGDSRWQA
ncbi:MAG: sulfatase [Planctomycetota bacterium]|jgi:arylsulfatase A-like enzyme